LYHRTEFRELFRRVIVDIRNTLEIRDKLLDNGLPSDKTLDKDVRGSWGAMFFLSDWLRDMVEPCLLAREMEVTRDMDAPPWFMVGVWMKDRGAVAAVLYVSGREQAG
jgi:hypothetical protein